MSAPAPLAAREQGKPLNRVDGRLKVTGAAKYSAEFFPPNLAHAYPLMSTIAKGSITAIDTEAASRVPGVLAVLTHLNMPKLTAPAKGGREDGIRIEERLPLSDAKIHYGGQFVALVVAERPEQARHAADLVRVTYASEKPALRKDQALETVKHPEENMGQKMQVKKGGVDAALKDASLTHVEPTYLTPVETHNPMEPSATVATWKSGDNLVLYDATQYVKGTQAMMAKVFGLKAEQVHVICPFVGGGFGCKGPVWPHTILAAAASRQVGRPVKLPLTRQQMFSGTGHRPAMSQTVALAANASGKLQALRHLAENATSPVGQWIEPAAATAGSIFYAPPAIQFGQTVFTLNIAQPSFMRAPGECPGTYAIECAMDELAYALKLDPVQLRLTNDTPDHPVKGVPFSTRHLRECLETGAAKFGWDRRKPEPQSMREGRVLVGWGVAAATYPANQWAAEAIIVFRADGSAIVRCAAHDLGTGAYTALTQIAADALGLPSGKIRCELGDSAFPFGPVAGGSNSTATVGSAITATARDLHAKLAAMASADAQSPLYQVKVEDIIMSESGRLGSKSMPSKTDPFSDILRRASLDKLEVTGGIKEEKNEKMAFHSFGAHFCEVRIDRDLPRVRVSRVVSVMDCGRVINPKTGGSQILGGVVMGIGMALQEETVYDPATGLPVTRNLADYHVPVNADIQGLEVHFVGEPDLAFNAMGARGMGEIGITGVAAAIANAVFHATGKRVRELPVTIDKLL